MTKSKFAFLLGLFIPAFFAFKPLVLPGPVVWGDAPFFYPEGLRELAAEPFAWISRGNNFGGPNNLLWISPLMLVYGLLNRLFGIDNDAIIRILFYFPSIALAFIAPIIFARKLGYSKVVQFFASLLYGLNTYFLLLIDGGQIGVALAYGLFPLALFFVRNLLKAPSFLRFFLALLLLFLTTVADPRFAAITIFAALLWGVIKWFALRKADEVKNLKFLVTLVFANSLLSLYWLIPLTMLGTETLSVDVSRLQLLSLLNPLLLFQPHWPLNEFGKVFPPPFYFAGVPFLVFGSLLWLKDRKTWSMTLLVLIFAFLVKGETPPLGEVYSWVVNLPFGPAFRDSTKFFTPLILFSGILMGLTIESVGKRVPIKVVLLASYAYLLFLLYPAFTSELNGVLAGRAFPQDFEIIHQELAREKGFFRTAWFPERSPFAFHTEEKPALDAKRLVDERPFATLNVGTFDVFNFLHNEQYLDWFDILGIKYLILSGEARKSVLNKEERKDWVSLLKLAKETRGIEKVEWGTSFPIYRVAESKPHIFGFDKLIGVVGGDSIYQKLKEATGSFSMGNQGFVFFDDGKFNPRNLEDLPKDSVILVFNDKSETDLAMSFLQEYFVAPTEYAFSRWAVRDADDYLGYKYELLINGVDTKEFDYSKGIAFSSVKGEKISWDLPIPADGDFILATRVLEEQAFSWNVSNITLKKGVYPLTLTNDGGFMAVNAVALVPKAAWDDAQELVNNLTSRFDVVRLDESSETEQLMRLIQDRQWREVTYETVSPVRYKIKIPEGVHWLVFSDSYNKGWILERGPISLPSYPFYSMINGFHPRPEWREAEIVFEGQKDVRWGIYLSTISFLSLVIIFLWLYPKTKDVD